MTTKNDQKDWPFAETFEEVTNLANWEETTQSRPVPPHVALMMEAAGVTNPPSDEEIPLTLRSLRLLIARALPGSRVSDDVRGDTCSGHYTTESSLYVYWNGTPYRVHNNLGVAKLVGCREAQDGETRAVEDRLIAAFNHGDWKPTPPESPGEARKEDSGEAAGGPVSSGASPGTR